MWLVDTHTLALKRFQDDRKAVDKYAILSHRWQREEVLFSDLAIGRNVEVPVATRSKFGFAKFENACRCAREEGLRYLWMDTCCINKESSAELSEAIASMWRWYSDSVFCFAYLCDVDMAGLDGNMDHAALLRLLRHSAWFRRGWTLQELIAPSIVKFYDRNWIHIGIKGTTVMTSVLSTITGIGENALIDRDMVNTYCIAKRLSWAAKRETTRVEDEAYCLLGLFDVHMPMMYGEGKKAFLRLQEEIVRSSTDHSIFAWVPKGDSDVSHFSALFAPHSRCFTGLRLHKSVIEDLADDESYELTNRGLRISLPVHERSGHLYALLNCTARRAQDRKEVVVLKLRPHERQNQVAPKQNARIVCEIERTADLQEWWSRPSLEPLRWMDLTILRHGLTAEVHIQLELLSGRAADVSPVTIRGTPEVVLTNPTGRPISAAHIVVQGCNERCNGYLSMGQRLRQTDSFSTFRIELSSTPLEEHELLQCQPWPVAIGYNLDTDCDGLLIAEASLRRHQQSHRPYWLVQLWHQDSYDVPHCLVTGLNRHIVKSDRVRQSRQSRQVQLPSREAVPPPAGPVWQTEDRLRVDRSGSDPYTSATDAE